MMAAPKTYCCLPMVWTRQAYNNEFENASLLTRDALKRRLDEFISEGMTKNMPLLQQVNDPALLVDWVVRTTEHWERRYKRRKFLLAASCSSMARRTWSACSSRYSTKMR